MPVNSPNVSKFIAGFKIPKFTVVLWQVTNAASRITGPITFLHETSCLVLQANLRLGTGGKLEQQNFIQTLANGNNVYDQFELPLIMTINDTNYPAYKNGFTIPNGIAYEWATTKPVNGTITFQGNGSYPQLRLIQNLHLGQAGTISGTSLSIDGQSHAIVLGDNVALAAATFAITSDLIINGSGNTLTITSPCSFSGASLTLKNMSLLSDSTNFLNTRTATLNNVTIKSTLSSSTQLLTLCGDDCERLTFKNNVSLDSPNRRIRLASTNATSSAIVAGGALRIYPGVIFEPYNAIAETFFSMEDATATLILDGCDFYTGSKGVTVDNGRILFDHKVNFFTKDYGTNFDYADDSPLTINANTAIHYLNGSLITLDGDLAVAS